MNEGTKQKEKAEISGEFMLIKKTQSQKDTYCMIPFMSHEIT